MNKTVPELANRWLRRNPENLSELERRVLQSTVDRKPISQDINDNLAGLQGAGDRIADAIARVGGSWTFILSFIAFLILWIGANWWLLGQESFDPYPFIFLNLVLSMIAALQAPVIMMSQNRQDTKDRLRGELDFDVNKRAESEIQGVSRKLHQLTEKIEDLEEALRERRA